MKIIILILISTYLLSANNFHEGNILCISEGSIELEKPLQTCEHHIFEVTDSFRDKDCLDHELPSIDTYQSNYKLKFIDKSTRFFSVLNSIWENYEYKVSLKSELKKRLNYNKIKLVYSSYHLKQTKTTVIRT